MRFAFIAAEKASFTVVALCRVLDVSESGFYAWQKRETSAHDRKDLRLQVLIKAFFEKSRRTYGSPRLHRDLVEAGERVGRNRVIRIMQKEGLRARPRKRFRCTTMSDHPHPVAKNKLARDFEADAPNRRWVGDTTELRTTTGARFYLAAIIDLYARAVVGWAVSAINDRHLALGALTMALQHRRPPPGLLHHSDRGSPYASEGYRRVLAANGITCSMSRSGNCLDNAAMESWFSTLKFELGDTFESIEQARSRLFDYIELFYNRQRRHSTIDYATPMEYEQRQAA
jgi:transposase InsO family protein